MYLPTLDDVRQLASTGNLIPVYRILPADLETPVSVYLKLRQPGKSSFLLESVEKGEQLGRYSFIGIDPPISLTIARQARSRLVGAAAPCWNTLSARRRWPSFPASCTSANPSPLPDLPSFTGGAVGFWSYDIVRHFEHLPATASDELDLPDAAFVLADNLVIFDHVKHRLLILLANARLEGDLTAAYADAVARIENDHGQAGAATRPAPAA